jgi:AraC-like DNA-binding protein
MTDDASPGVADESIDYRDADIWLQVQQQVFAAAQPRLTGLSGYYDCPPDWRWSSNLRDFDIWLVIRGRGTVAIPKLECTWQVEPGTLLLFRPGDQVAATQDPDHLLTVVASHMDFYDPMGDEVIAIPDHLLPHREITFPDFSSLERHLRRLFRLQDAPRHLASTEATMLLGQILVDLYRQDAAAHGAPEASRDPRIERVITRLRQASHLRLSLADAAAIAGLTPDYFSRLFAREMQMPYRDYIMLLRLERSRYLLHETDLTVSEIARQLGYSDIYLFSRQFKSHFGHPPSRTRLYDITH